MSEDLKWILGLVLPMLVIPWCAWVTHSIYTQEKKLSILENIFQLLQDKLIGKQARVPVKKS